MLSIDTETTGRDLHHGANVYLVTTSDQSECTTHWEWFVNPETRQAEVNEKDLGEIFEEISKADRFIFQNSRFDIRGLTNLFETYGWSFSWDWSRTEDTLIAGHLLASNQPHDLATMVMVYTGLNIFPLEESLNVEIQEARKIAQRKFPNWALAKKGLPCMPSAEQKVWKSDAWLCRLLAKTLMLPESHPWWTVTSDYANGDSFSTMKLWSVLEEHLKQMNLWKIYRARMEALPAIYSIEGFGATYNKRRMDELDQVYSEESRQLEQRCIRISNGTLDKLPKSGASNKLKTVLFNQFGLTTNRRTPKGQLSVDKFTIEDWLLSLSPKKPPHIFLSALRAFRKRQNVLSFFNSYRKFGLPTFDDDWYRLYFSLNPVGTDTLRFTSSKPNSQQFSKQEIAAFLRKKWGHSVRWILGPAPGREWWSCDAKNIELRIPAYEANEKEMVDLFERSEEPPYYGSVHLLMFDVLHPEKFAEYGAACKEKFEDTWYQWVKNGDFAVQYGSIEESGTADRAYHVPGAFQKIKQRFRAIHGPGGLNSRMILQANNHGYVETIPDSSIDPERGYPLYCKRSKWGQVKPTIPLNYHVQGTAMWWMMMAMIRCHRQLEKWRAEGFDGYMVMQVHDELVFDFPAGGVENIWRIKELMALMEEGGQYIGIPIPVSCKYHDSTWEKGISISTLSLAVDLTDTEE